VIASHTYYTWKRIPTLSAIYISFTVMISHCFYNLFVKDLKRCNINNFIHYLPPFQSSKIVNSPSLFFNNRSLISGLCRPCVSNSLKNHCLSALASLDSSFVFNFWFKLRIFLFVVALCSSPKNFELYAHYCLFA